MLEDITLIDFVKVIAMLSVLGVLLVGFIEGVINFGKDGKNWKEKIVDLIFSIDLFLAAWWGITLFVGMLAGGSAIGFGIVAIALFIPPVLAFISAILLIPKQAKKYRYIIIGFLVSALVPTIAFWEAISSMLGDIF